MESLNYIVLFSLLPGTDCRKLKPMSRRIKSSGGHVYSRTQLLVVAVGNVDIHDHILSQHFRSVGGVAYRSGIVAVIIGNLVGIACLVTGRWLAGRWRQIKINSPGDFIAVRFGKTTVELLHDSRHHRPRRTYRSGALRHRRCDVDTDGTPRRTFPRRLNRASVDIMGCGDIRSHHPRVYHSRRISRGTDDRRNSVRCTHRGGPVRDTPLAAHYRWSRQLHINSTGTARHVYFDLASGVSVDMASGVWTGPSTYSDGRRLAIRTRLYQCDRTRRTQEYPIVGVLYLRHPYTCGTFRP